MASTALRLRVPGVGWAESVLRTIVELCGTMKESSTACRRVCDRLHQIYEELERMQQADRLPPPVSLEGYTQTLRECLAYLKRYGGKSLHWRLIYHARMMKELFALNEEIDAVVMRAAMTTGAMDQWKQHWQDDRASIVRSLAELVEDREAVLAEVRTKHAKVEAITVLRYKIHREQGRPDDKILHMMKEMNETITSACNVRVAATPAWFILESDVQYDPEPFAQGSYGAIHLGTLGSGAEVVVKTLAVGMTETLTSQCWGEVDVWYKLNHPHVVKLYGASHVSKPPFIVCEHATKGNLSDYLRSSNQGRRPMWTLLYEVALGLECLHNNRVVHGDLKLNNCLVGGDNKVRIADFGLSFVRMASMLSESKDNSDTQRGALRWSAPECLKRRPTFASDVYSLAMCFLEAATGEPPFAYLDNQSVRELLNAGEIPEKPETMTEEQWELVKSMTVRDPTQRRSLASVILSLERYAKREAAEIARGVKSGIASHNDVSDREPLKEPSSPVMIGAAIDPGRVGIVGTDGINISVDDVVKENAPVGMWRRTANLVSHFFKSKAGGIQSLVSLVRDGTEAEKEKAARELTKLASNAANQVTIAEAGGIEPLIALVRDGTDAQKENGASALGNLAVNAANHVTIAEAGGIEPLIALVRDGTDAQKENAANALGSLASNAANQATIAEAGGIQPLIALVHAGTETQKENAAGALWNLASNAANKVMIAETGGIKPLIALVRDGTETQKENAANALWNLACNATNQVMIAEAGGVEALAVLAANGNNAQKESARGALRNLNALR